MSFNAECYMSQSFSKVIAENSDSEKASEDNLELELEL